jgi:hypothetical protein
MTSSTRSELPAQLRSAAREGIEAAKDVATAAATLVVALAGAAAGWVRADVEQLRTHIDYSGASTVVSKPVPFGLILAGSAAVGVVVYLVVHKPSDVRRPAHRRR